MNDGATPGAANWRALLWRAAAFVLLFALLQAGWEAARGTWIERLWVHELTVGGAVLLINAATPAVQAVAQAARIVAPGGGLNVLFGCEGADVVFLLAAAFCVFPMPWRWRLSGIAVGLVWAYLLNQLRVLALFYAFRSDRELFDLLHTAVAPLVLVVLSAMFFHLWLRRVAR
jgi:exosortase/archaeosortase family protein